MAKSRLTKAKEISQETKQKVWDRQHGRSISGVALSPYKVQFHHVIPRSDSGVGYELNIVAITFYEHSWYHDKNDIKVNGRNRYTWLEFEILMKNYLKLHYRNWSEENCRVRKYAEEEDYGVVREEMV